MFGFKLHAKTDTDLGLIQDLEVTTASVHDSRVHLYKEGEVVYGDRGYFGVAPRGFDSTMGRRERGRSLGIRDRLRNRRISRRRAPGERPFAAIKRVFDAGHVLMTMLPKVQVKMVFACLCFNFVLLGTLRAYP